MKKSGNGFWGWDLETRFGRKLSQGTDLGRKCDCEGRRCVIGSKMCFGL